MPRARARYYDVYPEGPAEERRCCDVPACAGEGLYRAPKHRTRLNEYYWFCLDHVREYNKAWDFCAGMSSDQIEDMVRRSTIWERPTWPFGGRNPAGPRTRDHFGFFDEEEVERRETKRRAAAAPEAEALAVLGLEPPVDFARIKARYRELVKRHHPDANGGDKAAEERVKTINAAYSKLKAAYADREEV